MALKKNKEGNYSLRSEKQLAEALALRDDMEHMAEGLREKIAETKLGQALQSFEEDAAALSAAIDRFVLERYSAGEGYEDANWKLTKVVGHSRRWNADKLQKLIPYGVFKKIVKVEVVPNLLNEAVKNGEIDLEAVDAAYEDTPNAPYVKRTRRSQSGGDEAAMLAEKLA
jgi:hypothetical protein